MTRYISVSESQLPPGKTALLLFEHNSHLCAGTLEHRCDGRILRRLPHHPRPTELISVISELIAGQGLDGDLYVVLDPGAYWPDAFPILNGL